MATTRAKDPKIVTESQKVFDIVKKIFIGLFILFLVLVVVRWGQEKVREAKAEMEAAAKKAAAAQAAPARAEKVQLPLCAGGDYDFSRAKIPGKVVVAYRPDCISDVTLPARCVYRTEPSSDVKITFIDGSSFVDGPGKRVWFGLKRGIFNIHGLTQAGKMEIFLEKRN